MDQMIIVIHYSEIAAKGRNRAFFENKLIESAAKNAEKKISALNEFL